jgi:outer membrane protein
MTRNQLRILLFAALYAATAAASADETLDQARQLLSDRQAAAAYQLLAPLEDERAGTPDFDYLLGLAALDAGHAGEAVFALERVLAVDPNHTLARAEIARAYYALSELQTAKQEFENVMQAGDVPDSARATMDKYLSLIERAQSGRRITGFLTGGGGYDTNLNSGTDQSQVAIPLFGNLVFQLNDLAQEREHGFALIAGGADISQPLNKTWSAIGGVRGYYRHTEDPFSTRDIYLYGGVRAEQGKHQFTLAAQGENFAIENDSLRYVYGGFGQWTYALDNRSRLSLSMQISQIDYPDLPNRDAVRYVGSLGFLRAIGGKREPVIYAGAYGGVEEEDRNRFGQFGHDLYGARIGGSLELCERTRGFASASFEQRDYHGDDPIFLRTRDDTQYMLTGGVEYALRENLQLKPYVSYTNADSNIPINDFDRVIGGVDLTMRF